MDSDATDVVFDFLAIVSPDAGRSSGRELSKTQVGVR
jgi:hypothetical protein